MGNVYRDLIIVDHPILYWRLDETSGGTATDASGNGRNGTYTGTPTLGRPGQVDDGTAVGLNGTTQYVARADEAALDFLNLAPFSLECWIKPTTVDANFRRVMSHEIAGPTGYLFYFQNGAGVGIIFSRAVAGEAGATSGLVPVVGRWYHLVGTYDGANVRLYIDGVLRGGPTADARNMPNTVTSEFRAGANSSLAPPFTDALAGDLDEVAVYDYALTAAQVALHFQAGNVRWVPTERRPVIGLLPGPALGPPAYRFQSPRSTDIPAVQGPFALQDWPNPPGYQPKHRDHQNSYNLALVGQDRIYGAPGQVPSYERPNPTLARPNLALHALFMTLVTATLRGLDALPFRRDDWQNPRGYASRQDHRGSYNLTLIGKDALPFSQRDWPVPRGYAAVLDLRTWLQSLVNSTLQIVNLPFALVDWPNPFRARPKHQDHQSWYGLNLVGLDSIPFRRGDWPNPLRYPPQHQDRGAHHWYNLNLLGLDALPFRRGDWPNPRGYIFAVGLRTWLGALQQQLLGVDSLPFRRGDWPNPLRYRPRNQSQDHQGWYTLALVGQDQFFGPPGQGPANLDWPVPRGYPHFVGLRSWLLNLLQNTLTPVPPPPPTSPTIIYLKESGRIAVRLTQSGRLYEELS